MAVDSRALWVGLLAFVRLCAGCGSSAAAGGARDGSAGVSWNAGGVDGGAAGATDDATTDPGTGGAGDDAGPAGTKDAWTSDAAASNGPDAGPAGTPEAGCSGSAGEPRSTSGLPGWAGDWSPGDYPSGDITAQNYLTIDNVQGQKGNSRQYKVHVPPGYSKSAPAPVVFCLHGLGQNAVMFCLDTGVAWNTKSDQEDFILVMPNGYMNSWNAGTCCGAAASSGLDDVALVRAIFTEVGKHVNIDLGRVYATGLSNGGYLSYRLACEASDLFVAVAPNAGAIGTAAIGGGTQATSDLATCAPTSKVSILDIHGTSDPLVAYSLQKPSLALMQASNGCSTTTVPATVPPSGGDTACVTFAGCPTCPNVEVTGCTITGGGHCWFGSSDCGTGGGAIGSAVVGADSNFMKDTDQIWAFFRRLSR